MKKDEIKKFLDDKGITYDGNASKDVLEAIMLDVQKVTPERAGGKEIEVRLDEKEPVVIKGAEVLKIERIALLEAYKLQNPVKFKLKELDEELKELKK